MEDYDKTVLYQKTNEELFDWITARTDYACPFRPAELKFKLVTKYNIIVARIGSKIPYYT